MSAGYKLTSLAATQPGMMLSDVLLDAQGHMLLPAGTVLTGPMLASLARHEVDMLPILVADAELPVEDPQQLRIRLDYLFRNNDRDDADDWATGILRRYIEDYRLGQGETP